MFCGLFIVFWICSDREINVIVVVYSEEYFLCVAIIIDVIV